MRLRSSARALAFGLAFGLSPISLGTAARADDPTPAASPAPIAPERTVVTHHSARIGGRAISYNAIAGTILLHDAQDQPTASVFYHAYVATGLGASARRPITFSYNGGPGGSSALVDIGAFGPRSVVTINAAQSLPPPYRLVDNADSILDKTDLVFVDAVGTGFSRLAGKGKPKDYYGVDEDGDAFAQFIRRFITTNDRWNSPKYLIGESYGTTRSAVLAKKLEDRGIAVSGVTLMSTVLDFATLEGRKADDERYWTYLPTFAQTAAYYKKLPEMPADLNSFVDSVRAYAIGPYAHALALGDTISPAERDAVAAQLHAYTGLPLDYILRSNLRIPAGRFEKTLLGDRAETIGRYDSRFNAFELDPIDPDAETDPSSDAVFGAFTATFNAYVREELNFKTDAEYRFLAYDVNRDWNWNRGPRSEPVATDVVGDLASAMTTDRYLRVLSVNGIYDLATPFFATEVALHHLGIAPQLQSNVSYAYFPSGHMIYLNPVAHEKLKETLDRFYDGGSH